MVELPFISTCLVVSVGRECHSRDSQVTAGPLGLVYTDETMGYGMAVVDISDLDCVRYGIAAFGTSRPLILGEHGLFSSETVFEPTREWRPTSAKAYMEKFAPTIYAGRGNECLASVAMEVDKLQMEKYQLVGLDALEGKN
jgi:hypothetical protein